MPRFLVVWIVLAVGDKRIFSFSFCFGVYNGRYAEAETGIIVWIFEGAHDFTAKKDQEDFGENRAGFVVGN
jgi:hypothetical protein